jgi:type IV pilus assembly protein PilA
MQTRHKATSGITLVELLIVIAVLGLLAAVAIPQFTSPKEQGKTAAMVSSLSILRTAIDSYWSQHDGFPGTSTSKFANQLLEKSNKAGSTGSGATFGYGPYLRNGQLPTNPLTNTNTMKMVETMPTAPSGNQAWIYNYVTGEVRSNSAGKDLNGVPYFSL